MGDRMMEQMGMGGDSRNQMFARMREEYDEMDGELDAGFGRSNLKESMRQRFAQGASGGQPNNDYGSPQNMQKRAAMMDNLMQDQGAMDQFMKNSGQFGA